MKYQFKSLEALWFYYFTEVQREIIGRNIMVSDDSALAATSVTWLGLSEA